MPQISISLVYELLSDAFIVTIISSVCTLSIVKDYCKKNSYPIDYNQEYISYGLGNVLGSFFHCVPYTGSLSRSNVNVKAGAQSQLSSLVSCSLLLVFVYFFAGYFENLPKVISLSVSQNFCIKQTEFQCTLSSIIIASLAPTYEYVKHFINLIQISKFDSIQWIITTISVVCFDINNGVLYGVIVSIVLILLRHAL